MPPIDSIQPADCYAHAQLVAAELELIRLETGRSRDRRPAITVTGASPREVYFQAVALFRKIDRLGQEITGDPIAMIPHAPPAARLLPGHVWMVLDAALRELAQIKSQLGITEKSTAPAVEPTRTPSDVYGCIATANRLTNQLLERPFAPADVYQQLSLAVAYTARLQGQPPPATPALQRQKRPADVYDRLLGCLETTRTLVRRKDHPVIDQLPARGETDDISPSDVYDLASLILGETAFLHALSPEATPPYPFEANLPGRRLPAHCFQLAGVLEAQLAQLAR